MLGEADDDAEADEDGEEKDGRQAQPLQHPEHERLNLTHEADSGSS